MKLSKGQPTAFSSSFHQACWWLLFYNLFLPLTLLKVELKKQYGIAGADFWGYGAANIRYFSFLCLITNKLVVLSLLVDPHLLFVNIIQLIIEWRLA